MSDQKNTYQIVSLTEADFEQTAEILTHYWNITLEASRQRLRWKYLDCPLAKTALFYVALHENKVVGTLGFFPIPFQLNGQDVNILCPGDAFIASEHRRFGIYTKLFLHGHRELAQHFDFFVSLSANPASAAGLMKIGWRALAMRQDQSHFKKVPSLRYLLRMPALPINSDALVSDFHQIVDLYEKIPLCHHSDTKSCCVPHMDRTYVEWRYSNPTEKYVAIPYFQHGELQAFAVCMVTGRDAFLLDYRELKGTNALAPVLRLMKKHIRIPRFILPVFIFSDEQRNILTRCGFHDYRPIINCFIKRPAVPILVHPVCEKPEDHQWFIQGQYMGAPSHWLIPELCNDGY